MSDIYILSQTALPDCISNPILKITHLQNKCDFEFDCLVFTSKNGVIGFDKIYPDWKKYPSFAIGKATAKTIEALGGRVSFVCENSYGKDLASEINRKYRGLTFLWARGANVAIELQNEIRSSKCLEIVVYEATYNEDYKAVPNKESVIIFSSPSMVEHFIKKQEWIEKYKAVAIGKTTAQKLQEYGIKSLIANHTSLKSSINLAKTVKL